MLAPRMGGFLKFQSKKEPGDYHNEMSHQTFEERFINRNPINRIPPHSIIVMDNAPYHSSAGRSQFQLKGGQRAK